jgi:hypothetical protein
MTADALGNSDIYVDDWSLRITVEDTLPMGKYLNVIGVSPDNGELVDRLLNPQTSS